jgi:transposase
VERGCRFLTDPFFLASCVFVKKPERVMALRCIMVRLLIYRLAEHVRRRQLAQTSHTVPSQVNKPTNRPTMRWIFHCFEGIDLLHLRLGSRFQTQILRLLGSASCPFSFFSP